MGRRKKFICKVFNFDCEFNEEYFDKWLAENSELLWDEFFRALAYIHEYNISEDFIYAYFMFENIQLSVSLIYDKLKYSFEQATRFYIKRENYEMCQYVKEWSDIYGFKLDI